MVRKRYTMDDARCWANDASGWKHVREVLADLVDPHEHDLARELRGGWGTPLDDPPELEALEILQRHTGGWPYLGARRRRSISDDGGRGRTAEEETKT